jgi:hypothetical protein
MEYTRINLNTLIPQLPTIINNNSEAFKNALKTIYDASLGIVIVPVTTSGKVKGGMGEFVTCVVDNLIVKKQFTNLLSNNTTADLDYYNTYWGPDASTRDASTWEDAEFRYIDAISPYYKISNESSIAFSVTNVSQVVDLLFDVSLANNDFNIRLDASTKIIVTAADSSKAWMQLICVKNDPYLGNTWAVKQYGGTYSITNW